MEAVNTEITETQETEQVSAEQTDEQKEQARIQEEEEKRNLQIEKSRLGQKYKKLESGFTNLDSKVDMILERLNDRKEETSTDTDDENFLTKKEVKKIYRDMQKEFYDTQNRARTEYENNYLSHLKNFGTDEDEDDLHATIIDEVMKNPKFNVRHSNDPVSDAERNYLRAKLHILSTKDRKIPIGGKKPNAPLGVGGDTDSKVKDKALPKLDPDAAEFVKKMGLSDDFIKKALDGDAPNYLKRK